MQKYSNNTIEMGRSKNRNNLNELGYKDRITAANE
jgi:hypothetical protein